MDRGVLRKRRKRRRKILKLCVFMLLSVAVLGAWQGRSEDNALAASRNLSITERGAVANEPQPKVADEPQPKAANEPQPKAADEPQPKVANEPQPKVANEPQPQKVDIDSGQWNLALVNKDNPMQTGYLPELAVVDKRGSKFDVRAVDTLKQMLEDAQKAGLSPIICSSYRTGEKQTKLFENQVYKLQSNRLSYEQAVDKAKTIVAYPGTSEHQLGLAADIVALSYQNLDEKQAETSEQQWLMAHCAEYGFILRYPKGKENVTGVIYEPWHYRYVGKEHAKEMMEKGITLEEYLKSSPLDTVKL